MQHLTFAEVGEILGLIEKMDCDTFSLEYGELRISVERSGPSEPATEATPTAHPELSQPPAPARRADDHRPAVPQTPTDHGRDAEVAQWDAVAAPMAGTFYRSPSPGDPPWVEVGDRVAAGQTVGVLEVMKLFTELKAEGAGTIVRIDAEDGALVEYEQPLVWIEPR